jgi:hypothetical protein
MRLAKLAMARRNFVKSCNVMYRQAWPRGFGLPRLNMGAIMHEKNKS